MRPRFDTIIRDGRSLVVDIAGELPIDDARLESKADVRGHMWRKIKVIDSSAEHIDALLLTLMRFTALVDRRATESLSAADMGFMAGVRAVLARASALHRAAQEIEAEIDRLPSTDAVFVHNERLAANPLWPE
jgi:hypothetical protein